MYPKVCKCGKILYSENDLEDHAKECIHGFIDYELPKLSIEELYFLRRTLKIENKSRVYEFIKAKDITNFDDTNFKN